MKWKINLKKNNKIKEITNISYYNYSVTRKNNIDTVKLFLEFNIEEGKDLADIVLDLIPELSDKDAILQIEFDDNTKINFGSYRQEYSIGFADASDHLALELMFEYVYITKDSK